MAKIYLSSTYTDLVPFRQAVFDALTSLGHQVLAMEHYLAADERPVEKCLTDVAACDVYVGIFAWRYGYVPAAKNPGKLSITEMEYRKAAAVKNPRLIFLLHEDAQWFRKWDDSATGEHKGRIERLRQEFQRDRTVSVFKTEQELAKLVMGAVTKWEQGRNAEKVRPSAPSKHSKPSSEPPSREIAVVPPGYRDWLKRECGSIELLGLRLTQGQSVRIGSVYVPLATTLREDQLTTNLEAGGSQAGGAGRAGKAPGAAAAGQRRRDKKSLASAGRPEQATLLLNLLDGHSLYVSGPPGSGKSTFCRWVAWLLADGTMPRHEVADEDVEERFPGTLRGKLPVLIQLRDFHDFLPAGRDITISLFERSLEAWMNSRKPGGLEWPAVKASLARGRTLVIFDGADEVPPARRKAFVKGLAQCLTVWRASGNRVLLTSRPYGLSDADIRQLDLPHARVDGLSAPLQRLLVRRWFGILAEDPESGATTASGLLGDLRQRSWLRPLAENPLLLTSMCIVYGQGRRLPQDKHELYDRIVDTVLNSRFDARLVPLVRNRLAVVAHGMHTGVGGEVRDTPEAQTTEKEVDVMLEAYQKTGSYYTEEGFMQVTESRERLLSDSGLLLPLEGRRASFYHLSFQEFLAAERMADLDRDRLLELLIERGDRPEWRNTLSFVFGAQLANNVAPRRAAELLRQLLARFQTPSSPALAVLAADCVEILRGRNVTLGDEPLRPLREVCLTAMRSDLATRDRCALGEALGRIGDPRFRADAWYLPDEDSLGFIEVPGGSFVMGTGPTESPSFDLDERPQHTVNSSTFYISRFPVTVAQFRAFAEDKQDNGGFKASSPDCLRGVDNHPVVLVPWSEAAAYCEWLTTKLRSSAVTPPTLRAVLDSTEPKRRWQVRLPSEAEWEKTARGGDKRVFPWGSEKAENRTNDVTSQIEGTSAVGCFPRGASPLGPEELSGNVWEWTRSLAHPYPYDAADGREDPTAEGNRVVRGGSFVYYVGAASIHAANRVARYPEYINVDLGFRVVISQGSERTADG